jgi:SulP family sulfate permease
MHDTTRHLPKGIAVYEIAGPLFFGAAQRAMEAFDTASESSRAVVLALGAVPVIDATGLVALESALAKLVRQKKIVVIAGPLPEPRDVFAKANLEEHYENVFVADTLDAAVGLAADLLTLSPEGAGTSQVAPAR